MRCPEAVATDASRSRDHVAGFGATVVMISPDCRNGTERCAEVLSYLPYRPDVAVNFQGDAPLTPPWFVEDLLAAMAADPGVQMATPVLPCNAQTLQNLLEDRRHGRVGATTAVFDHAMKALYFSKEVLPFGAPDAEPAPPLETGTGVSSCRRLCLPPRRAGGLWRLADGPAGTR